MKFFLIEADSRMGQTRFLDWHNNTNHNQLETFDFPRLTNFSVSLTGDSEFLDIISAPRIMLSKEFSMLVQMYDEAISFKYATLYDAKNKRHMTYGLPCLELVDCLSSQSRLDQAKDLTGSVVLRKEAVRGRTLFQIDGVKTHYYVASLELVESAFRREVRGLKVSEVELV